ncbi:MAG TPA: hypothetical protein VF786_09600 [Terriglobales bacterium]
MRRYFTIVAVLAMVVAAVGCGGVFFGFFTFSGTVSTVQIAVIDGDQVTIVILNDSGTSQTFHFCGNVVSRFSTNAFVTVNYRQNGNCYSLVEVIY